MYMLQEQPFFTLETLLSYATCYCICFWCRKVSSCIHECTEQEVKTVQAKSVDWQVS